MAGQTSIRVQVHPVGQAFGRKRKGSADLRSGGAPHLDMCGNVPSRPHEQGGGASGVAPLHVSGRRHIPGAGRGMARRKLLQHGHGRLPGVSRSSAAGEALRRSHGGPRQAITGSWLAPRSGLPRQYLTSTPSRPQKQAADALHAPRSSNEPAVGNGLPTVVPAAASD